MKNHVHTLMVAAAGIAVLAWAGAFTPQAAGQAPPGFVAGTESGFATFQTQCAQCHGNPNVDRAPSPDALREMTPEKIYEALTTGVMQQQASALNDGQKKALAEFMAGRPLGSAKSGDAENMGFQCRTQPAAGRSGDAAPSWNGWSPDLANTRFQPRAGRRPDGRAGAAPEAQVGVRLPVRRVGQRAADDRVGPRLRRQRQRLRLFDRREDGLRLLVVRERIDHPERDRSSARSPARRREVRGVLRRRPRQRLRPQRAERQAAVEDESRSALHRAHHRRHPLLRRQGVRAGLVVRRVQQRQPRLLLLHVARQRRRARRQHRQADLESLGRARRAEAVQDDGERRDAVRAGRRRGVELADDRSGRSAPSTSAPATRRRRRRRRRRTPSWRSISTPGSSSGRIRRPRTTSSWAAATAPNDERGLPEADGPRHGHRQLADPENAAERQARADRRHEVGRHLRARSRRQRQAALPDSSARPAAQRQRPRPRVHRVGRRGRRSARLLRHRRRRARGGAARRPANARGSSRRRRRPAAAAARSSARRRRRFPASCSRARRTASCTRCRAADGKQLWEYPTRRRNSRRSTASAGARRRDRDVRRRGRRRDGLRRIGLRGRLAARAAGTCSWRSGWSRNAGGVFRLPCPSRIRGRRRSEFYCGGGPPPRPVTGGGGTYLSFSFLRYSGYIVSGPPTTASSGML